MTQQLLFDIPPLGLMYIQDLWKNGMVQPILNLLYFTYKLNVEHIATTLLVFQLHLQLFLQTDLQLEVIALHIPSLVVIWVYYQLVKTCQSYAFDYNHSRNLYQHTGFIRFYFCLCYRRFPIRIYRLIFLSYSDYMFGLAEFPSSYSYIHHIYQKFCVLLPIGHKNMNQLEYDWLKFLQTSTAF